MTVVVVLSLHLNSSRLYLQVSIVESCSMDEPNHLIVFNFLPLIFFWFEAKSTMTNCIILRSNFCAGSETSTIDLFLDLPTHFSPSWTVYVCLSTTRPLSTVERSCMRSRSGGRAVERCRSRNTHNYPICSYNLKYGTLDKLLNLTS